jgi:hypothetical protein
MEGLAPRECGKILRDLASRRGQLRADRVWPHPTGHSPREYMELPTNAPGSRRMGFLPQESPSAMSAPRWGAGRPEQRD